MSRTHFHGLKDVRAIKNSTVYALSDADFKQFSFYSLVWNRSVETLDFTDVYHAF